MKVCAGCGGGFLGLGSYCLPCSRRVKALAGSVTPVTEPAPVRVKTVTPVTPASDNRDKLTAERDRLLSRLAEINAEIGPMTAADRQRRYRSRQKA